MIAYFAEWQAKQEAKAGNMQLAGALRRMALAGAEADKRWILQDPYVSLKNQMFEHPSFGQDGYHPRQSAHSGYGLLAANLFAGAYHVADCGIQVGRSPADVGGYVLHLPDAFYRVWATAGPYHIEIDTKGQPGQDATGLGRIHKRGVPIETGLNMSIVAAPSYLMPLAKAKRSVALGVGWPSAGDWWYLAAAKRESHDVAVNVHPRLPAGGQGEDGPVEFMITYTSKGEGLHGATVVSETYRLSDEGLHCTVEVRGAPRLRLQVPVIETDGKLKSEIKIGVGRVEVRYAGHTYVVTVHGCNSAGTMEAWIAPNRNGIYRVVVFDVEGAKLSYVATLQ
jgi:hypothetical protein